eukprot:1604819-Rhodomonas_salina.1
MGKTRESSACSEEASERKREGGRGGYRFEALVRGAHDDSKVICWLRGREERGAVEHKAHTHG